MLDPGAPGEPRYVLASDAVTEEIDGRLAVVAPTVQRILFLNETAAVVWRQLAAGAASQSALSQALATAYGQPRDDVAAEVTRVLRDLQDAGVVSATATART